jgi:hypothetical protein
LLISFILIGGNTELLNRKSGYEWLKKEERCRKGGVEKLPSAPMREPIGARRKSRGLVGREKE